MNSINIILKFLVLFTISIFLIIFASKTIDKIFKKLKIKNPNLNILFTKQISRAINHLLEKIFKK
jgi:hypothetical protein